MSSEGGERYGGVVEVSAAEAQSVARSHARANTTYLVILLAVRNADSSESSEKVLSGSSPNKKGSFSFLLISWVTLYSPAKFMRREEAADLAMVWSVKHDPNPSNPSEQSREIISDGAVGPFNALN